MTKKDKLVSVIDYGVASITVPGQTISGDLFIVKESENKLLIGVVDGLGHGSEAANAAKKAVAVLNDYFEDSIINMVKLCHESLKHSRGAVMALVSLNFHDETITWLSIGNVEGMLLKANPETSPLYENIIMRSGVVGYRLPPLYASVIPISKNDILILSTDGISDDYVPRIVADIRFAHEQMNQSDSKNKSEVPIEIVCHAKESEYTEILLQASEPTIFRSDSGNLSPQELADYINRRFAKGNDDALVLVAKYLGKKTPET